VEIQIQPFPRGSSYSGAERRTEVLDPKNLIRVMPAEGSGKEEIKNLRSAEVFIFTKEVCL